MVSETDGLAVNRDLDVRLFATLLLIIIRKHYYLKILHVCKFLFYDNSCFDTSNYERDLNHGFIAFWIFIKEKLKIATFSLVSVVDYNVSCFSINLNLIVVRCG